MSQVSLTADPKNGLQVLEPQAPAEHDSVPKLPEHSPTPQVVGRRRLSSTVPSQSSSVLSQDSLVGVPGVHESDPAVQNLADGERQLEAVVKQG